MLVSNIASNLVPTPGVTDQSVAVDNTVKELASLDADTTHVKFTLDGADARATFDGSDPAADNGHLIPANANGVWSKREAAALKIIRAAGTDAYLHVTEFTLP